MKAQQLFFIALAWWGLAVIFASRPPMWTDFVIFSSIVIAYMFWPGIKNHAIKRAAEGKRFFYYREQDTKYSA